MLSKTTNEGRNKRRTEGMEQRGGGRRSGEDVKGGMNRGKDGSLEERGGRL